MALRECLKGSGHMGSWAVDSDGLPAFDFSLEQRCDEAAAHLTSSGLLQSDPVHLIGNGRGLVAMAHASGGVEIYSQDRGHKWINHIDDWRDPDNKDFPVQLGGGFNYLVVDGKVRSTRFEDHPVSKALGRQTRRFGVGYVETVTTFDDLRITRRVLAPDSSARALVSEVTIENLGDSYTSVGLVEFWDVNQYQLTEATQSADHGDTIITDSIRRERRKLNEEFTQTLSYSRQTQIASSTMTAASLPSAVRDGASPSKVDYFPADVYLATIDGGGIPDAVWLSDDELWKASQTSRPPPTKAAKAGDGETRELAIDAAQQSGILAMRVQVSVPTGAPVVRRFALGYTTPGVTPELAVAELRAMDGELAAQASESWAGRLAWVAVQGEDSGVIQRELAWSSYYAQASVTFDQSRGSRVTGAGGAAQYVAGLDAAPAELAMHAQALLYLDPSLAKENLLYAFSSQHGATSATPYRFPFATTGVDEYSDGANDAERSDAYFLLPTAVARYVAQTRDFDFLSAKTSYWPVSDEEVGSVLDHLSRSLDYANQVLGVGARGLIAFGTGDFEPDMRELGEAAGTANSSSVFNAALVSYGFPLLVELLSASEPDLSEAYALVLGDQAEALENQAFNGQYYERAFAESGDAIAGDRMFLSTQVLPILAGMVDETRRDALLDRIAAELDTPLGAVSQATGVGERSGVVVPVVNAWLTEAIALRDSAQAWSSLLRTTMAARADLQPELGYAPWTGPDAFTGPDAALPGQAPNSDELAQSDYPAFGLLGHLAPLRALVSLLGVRGDVDGLRIEPRIEGETFSVVLPRLELRGTPSSIEGVLITSGNDVLNMVVKLPSQARSVGLAVKVRGVAVPFDLGEGDTVEFVMPVRKDERATFSVRAI